MTSAGLLLHRERDGHLEVFIVHPGGPFWATKDDGAWSIPKGEIDEGEDPLVCARREFLEETGNEPPEASACTPLTPRTQRRGKHVLAWAARGDVDAGSIRSATFSMEWPPRSGREQTFPEVDRAAWFSIEDARRKINPGQVGFLDELEHLARD